MALTLFDKHVAHACRFGLKITNPDVSFAAYFWTIHLRDLRIEPGMRTYHTAPAEPDIGELHAES
jgi:hypothetical protein